MESTVTLHVASICRRVPYHRPSSRDIFFVAGARSLGIPARIDPVTGKTQYADAKGRFIDVDFGDSLTASPSQPKGSLQIDFTPAGRIHDPVYYSHFSISKIKNGLPQLLEYPEEATLGKINSDNKPLEAGQYLMVSGQRMANGNVLARMEIFSIDPGKVNTPRLVIRQDLSGAQVIGNFNSENLYYDLDGKTSKSLLSTTAAATTYSVSSLRATSQRSTPSTTSLSQPANSRSGAVKSCSSLKIPKPRPDLTARASHRCRRQ